VEWIHQPVLVDEVLSLIQPRSGGTYLDCTVGGGGHSAAILEATDCRVIGIDQHPAALSLARNNLERFGDRVTLVLARFSKLAEVLRRQGLERIDGLLADLGVSTPQLEGAVPGLSFLSNQQLDMRMSPELTVTAADIVNNVGEDELTRIFVDYGGEEEPRRIARAICARRAHRPFAQTEELVETVVNAKRRIGKIHPATKVFQSLRVAVNQEVQQLQELLRLAPQILAPAGVMAIIAFHSGEDRLVKSAFLRLAQGKAGGQYELLTRQAISPTRDEVKANPHSRSAKLRALRRLA
jgi:16S rRNA (cytosine1402-N4)-methyltransferase